LDKSSVEDIRRRFDADVERFSNIETGQTATIDASLVMSLICEAATATTPEATHVLDVGCGAGNFALKLLELQLNIGVTLIDLSRPMLDRAVERIRSHVPNPVEAIQNDIRDVEFDGERFDIILAATVLHHLRSDEEWTATFGKFYDALRPGGSIWIFDLVESSIPVVGDLMWQRYGEYLTALKDEAYRDHVFHYIDREDSPRSLMYQIDLLRKVGFSDVDVLHKNSCFAAFGAVKR